MSKVAICRVAGNRVSMTRMFVDGLLTDRVVVFVSLTRRQSEADSPSLDKRLRMC